MSMTTTLTLEDFTPWEGGERTLHPETVLIVRYRDGLFSRARRAKTLRWEHLGTPDDVVAYHIFDEPKEENSDEQPR